MTGLEPWIVTTAINFLAPLAEEVCKGFLKDGAGKLLKEGGDIDVGKAITEMVFEASKTYAKKYADRHGILKVLWMREHISLESVYTGVKFLDESETNRWVSVDALEQSYRDSKNRRFQKEGKTQDGMVIADDKQFLMVLGQPGAGKSTFLRRMGLEALKGTQKLFRHKCIPVFLELKTFKDDKVDIQKQIVAEFETCGFPEPERFTENALKQGKLLILLDGLDEVPKANINAVITQIEDFVDRYDKNRFISSCRIAAYRSKFRRFFDVAMADFDNEQISEFINNWFRSEKDKLMGTSQKCWELLQNDENEAAMELARTPLLLTFLCLVYDRSQGFPSNRSSLYSKALRILLEEWAADKRIEGWTIYEGLSTELEELLLAQIAYKNFMKDCLFFDRRYLVDQIKNFLASNLNTPKYLDGEAILNAMAVQQGILVERAEEVFSFSHLTLQEYLTAQYIVDHYEIEQLVANHLTERRWQEVFMLTAGLMRGGADNLLTAMETHTEQIVSKSPNLLLLLRWAEQAINESEQNFSRVAQKTGVLFTALTLGRVRDLTHNLTFDPAFGLAIILNRSLAAILANARSLSIVLDSTLMSVFAIDHALDLAQEFERINIYKSVNFSSLTTQLQVMKSQVPDFNQPIEVRQTFADRIIQIWCNAIHLDRNLLNLSKSEIKILQDYFYANSLIVQCKNAAVRVSPHIWQQIENLMLLPPS